jgi:hypothetical protein
VSPVSGSPAFEWMNAAIGPLAAFVAALAAVIKFQAWWSDRQLDGRIASAKALTDSARDTALRDFGAQEFERAHFARLTRIDRLDGHLAFIAAHRELGGRQLDWAVIRRALPYIRIVGRVASVRRLRRNDVLIAMSAAVLALALALGAAALLGVMIVIAKKILTGPISVTSVAQVVVLGAYAVVAGFFAWILSRIPGRVLDACQLRRRFAQLRCGSK